jgi:hypothetical protein
MQARRIVFVAGLMAVAAIVVFVATRFSGPLYAQAPLERVVPKGWGSVKGSAGTLVLFEDGKQTLRGYDARNGMLVYTITRE